MCEHLKMKDMTFLLLCMAGMKAHIGCIREQNLEALYHDNISGDCYTIFRSSIRTRVVIDRTCI